MARLYTTHANALAATFSDLENHAAAQEIAPTATPGSLLERTNAAGFRYYALQQYDQSGRKTETYLAGPVGDAKAEAAARAARAGIDDARGASDSVRLLVREGYAAMPPKPFTVVATLANAGLFSAGCLLIGTHAFEVIVNRLGIRASAFATEDLDLARPARLTFPAPLAEGFLGLLRKSGVDFVEVPNFDPRDPPIKFKQRGRSRFMVDLLVPTDAREPSVRLVPELGAHATALPYLRFLVEESQPSAAIARLGVAAIRVPLPERLAFHKMLVSQLRVGRPVKSSNDLDQAATLVAALSERQPGWMPEAFAALPKSARGRVLKSAEQMRARLADHPASLDQLAELSRRQ